MVKEKVGINTVAEHFDATARAAEYDSRIKQRAAGMVGAFALSMEGSGQRSVQSLIENTDTHAAKMTTRKERRSIGDEIAHDEGQAAIIVGRLARDVVEEHRLEDPFKNRVTSDAEMLAEIEGRLSQAAEDSTRAAQENRDFAQWERELQ